MISGPFVMADLLHCRSKSQSRCAVGGTLSPLYPLTCLSFTCLFLRCMTASGTGCLWTSQLVIRIRLLAWSLSRPVFIPTWTNKVSSVLTSWRTNGRRSMTSAPSCCPSRACWEVTMTTSWYSPVQYVTSFWVGVNEGWNIFHPRVRFVRPAVRAGWCVPS